MCQFLFDLNLDPMALILKLNPDMVKMYLCTKNKVLSLNGLKVITSLNRHMDRQIHRWTDTQTDTQTDKPDGNYYLSAYADGNNEV